jgi:hypothetical protein
VAVLKRRGGSSLQVIMLVTLFILLALTCVVALDGSASE